VRAPEFWYQPPGVAATFLAPLGWVYGAVVSLRLRLARPWKAPVPVICVGNLVAGGAGKTPVVLDLASRLLARGIDVHVISRGYGGTEAGPLRVDPDRHGFRAVGDEPLLLAEACPAWVAKDRRAGIEAAVAEGAKVVILDDGFQNPTVVKDLSLVVVDGGAGFGNNRVIPAGPLRESVSHGLARADAVVVMGDGNADVTSQAGDLPVLRGGLSPTAASDHLVGHPVVAFAGIGRPAKFFETLRALGSRVKSTSAFPDHHPFTDGDIDSLSARAEAAGAKLVTTAKDAKRLPPTGKAIEVLTVAVAWEKETALELLLSPVLDHAC